MATLNVKIDPKSLQCSLCLGTVSDPRILPCGHTFCGLKSSDKCLQNLDPANGGTIKCPICQTDHQVRVTEVPPDIKCNELLDSLVSNKQANRMCSKHNQEIILKCVTDGKEMCVFCAQTEHSGHQMEGLHVQEKNRLSNFWTKENEKLENKQLESTRRNESFQRELKNLKKQRIQEQSLCNQLANVITRRDAITRKLASTNFNPDDEDLMALKEYMDQLEATSECQQEASEDVRERSEQLIELVDTRASTYCQSISRTPMPADEASNQHTIRRRSLLSKVIPGFSKKPADEAQMSTGSQRVKTSKQDVGKGTLPRKNVNFTSNILALGEKGKHYILGLNNGSWQEWKGKRTDFECSFGAICYNGKVYIIGGRRHSSEEASSKVDIFHIGECKWTEGPGLNTPRFGAAACFVESERSIYICGGGKSGLIQDTLSSVEKLELYENGSPVGEWRRVTPMKEKRMGCAAVAVGSRLFVTGGVDEYSNYLSSVEVFDSENKEWTYGSKMQDFRYNHAIEHHDGCIYAIGGRRKRDERIATCEKLDLQSLTWTSIESMHDRCSHFGSAVVNDKIFVVGGYTKGKKNDDLKSVAIYDLKAKSWSRGPQLPTQLKNTKCVCW